MVDYEEREQWDVQPVGYFVLVTRREKRACKSCEERGVISAPLPPRIIEKSLVSNQVIVDTIISKPERVAERKAKADLAFLQRKIIFASRNLIAL